MISEKLVRMFIGIFIGVVVARYLGPKDYGLLNYVISFVGIFGIVATLGINNIVVRDLVHESSNANVILGTAFRIRLVGAILLMLIVTIAIQFTNNDSSTNLFIYILAFSPAVLSFNVIDFFFQSKVLSRFVVFSNLMSLLLSSVIKVILVVTKAPLIDFVVVMLIDSIILSASLIYFYCRLKLSIFAWSFDRNLALKILKQGLPLVFASFATMVYLKIDQVMLQEILGSEAVGQYAAAARLSEAWYFMPIAISSSLYPAIINAKQNCNNTYLERLQTLLSLVVWIAVIIAVPVTIFSNKIIDILYGNAYWQAGNILAIHIWAAIFVFLGEATTRWFITENLQKQLLLRTVVGALSNIVLNLFLIRKYGAIGAAVSSIISQFISVYILNVFGSSTFVIFKLQTMSLLAPIIYLQRLITHRNGATK